MAIIQLKTHVGELIFESIKQMVMAHKFTWNDDVSETEVGRLDKEFKLRLASAENTDRSNICATRVQGTFEIILYHNAEGDTESGLKRAMRDIENLIFEIQRFAPTGKYADVNSKYIEVKELVNWVTDPQKVGDDSRLRTVIQYEITYKVANTAT